MNTESTSTQSTPTESPLRLPEIRLTAAPPAEEEEVGLNPETRIVDGLGFEIKRNNLVFWINGMKGTPTKVGRVMAFGRKGMRRWLLVLGAEFKLGAWRRLIGLQKVPPHACVRVDPRAERYFITEKLKKVLI